MELKTVILTNLKPSKTNTTGRNEGPMFQDLVASVKEKGVLVPILVRKMKQGYEVIAGNRRLAAAKQAGLVEIPAYIVEMNDMEAREAQIIENLHRQDIHPLDEGEAYRKLIDITVPRYEVKDLALKTGKSETFIRQRLGLTNLSEKAKKAFRENKMSISQALIICRLDNIKHQDEATKQAVDYNYEPERLKKWVQEKVYNDLLSKPWAKNAKLAEMVGDKKEKTASLFGDDQLGTDPVIYARQMAAYIELKMREAQSKGVKMVRISTSWGTPEIKGVLGRDEYKIVGAKDECEKIKGIVVEGSDQGKIYTITQDKSFLDGTNYKKTAKEKAEVREKNKKEKERKEKFRLEFVTALERIMFPLTEERLEQLFDFALWRCGTSYQQPVVKSLEMEIVKTEQTDGWNNKKVMKTDYKATIEKYADSPDKKMRVIFALLMPQPPTHEYDNGADFKKAIANL